MSIDNVKFSLKSLESISKPMESKQPGKIPGAGEEGKESFGSVLKTALSEVNGMQLTADGHIEDLVLGKGNVSTHDAMIALEKADVAFQMMNTIRGRIIRAYEEVMRTQV
jgi:flagellar hook-basal body complex protein FliE